MSLERSQFPLENISYLGKETMHNDFSNENCLKTFDIYNANRQSSAYNTLSNESQRHASSTFARPNNLVWAQIKPKCCQSTTAYEDQPQLASVSFVYSNLQTFTIRRNIYLLTKQRLKIEYIPPSFYESRAVLQRLRCDHVTCCFDIHDNVKKTWSTSKFKDWKEVT